MVCLHYITRQGRQHDVSECMDNCMFQIETALLDFQGLEGAEADKTSVVKRWISNPCNTHI